MSIDDEIKRIVEKIEKNIERIEKIFKNPNETEANIVRKVQKTMEGKKFWDRSSALKMFEEGRSYSGAFEYYPNDYVGKLIQEIQEDIEKLERLVRNAKEKFPDIPEEDILPSGKNIEGFKEIVKSIEKGEDYKKYRGVRERISQVIRKAREKLEQDIIKSREEMREEIKEMLLREEDDDLGDWIKSSLIIEKEDGELMPPPFCGAFSKKMKILSKEFGVGMVEEKHTSLPGPYPGTSRPAKSYKLAFLPYKESTLEQKQSIIERKRALELYKMEIEKGNEIGDEVISIVLPVNGGRSGWPKWQNKQEAIRIDVTCAELIRGGILPGEMKEFTLQKMIERINSQGNVEFVDIGGDRKAFKENLIRDLGGQH